MNTNIVLRAALCSAVKGMDWWKNSFLFYIRFNQALANKEVHCVLNSDSDAQKTIKYDFDLLERNCLVQKLPQKTDVTFVRLDILNLDKYVG